MSASHPHAAEVSQAVFPAGHWATKAFLPGIILGLALIGAAFGLNMADHEHFFASFHVAYMYFLSISLGGLFFVLVQFATRAGWSVVIRRVAEALMGALPLFLVLFPVMIAGSHSLFHHWMGAGHGDEILEHKSPYLNTTFFYVRAAIYFLVWVGLSLWFGMKSREQDRTGDKEITRKLQARSYPGIALFALTATFAAFDWIMSMEPHWFSTIFGVYFFAGCAVSIYASLLLFMTWLRRSVPAFTSALNPTHFYSAGQLLLGHTCFWTYIAFSQFFLIWYANIPEDTMWFEIRGGPWLNTSVALALCHFAIPFLFLLPKTVKVVPAAISTGAIWMLSVHYLDLYWLITPSLYKDGPHFGLTDLLCLLGVGSMFLGVVFGRLSKGALIPAKDPRLSESLSIDLA